MYSFTQIAENIKANNAKFKSITRSFGQVGSVASAKKKMYEVLTLLDETLGFGCYSLERDTFTYNSYHKQYPDNPLEVECDLNGYILEVSPKEYLADIYELLVTLGFGRLGGDIAEVEVAETPVAEVEEE